MKVYLDDVRGLPLELKMSNEGWVLAETAEEAIKFLKTGEVTVIDLDHDLGTLKTGNDVLLWIEEQFFTNPDFILPKMYLHTGNPSAFKKMAQGIDRLNQLNKERGNV